MIRKKLLNPVKEIVSFLIFLIVFLFVAKEAWAISASGSWSAYDDTVKKTQTGTVKISFPAKGGEVNGTFDGGLGDLISYGGRISGSFSGGWSGSFSGSFSGWYSTKTAKFDPTSNQIVEDRANGNVSGPFSGSLTSDGKIIARFSNQQILGLSGGVTLHYSVEGFTKEFGEPPPNQASPQSSVSPQPSSSVSPSVSPSPSPSPSPEPKEITILDINGNPIKEATVKIRLKDGKIVDGEIKDGKINFDKSLIESINIDDGQGGRIRIAKDNLDKPQAVLANWEAWKQNLQEKLTNLAKILNDGQEVNLNDYFNINWDSDNNAYNPPAFDFLRKFGVKDKIEFYSGYITVEGNVDTPVHEALGHALTEVIGEGNKMIYAGGPHDDPWQPTYNERSKFNPISWLKGRTSAVSDDKAKGFAFSEGWAQYVGDKWNREMTATSDDKSEYQADKAKGKIADSKNSTYGKLYAGEPGYGAKVENVVATVFNELYKGKSLEETTKDFAEVRRQYKEGHSGKSFQNINQFIEQKLQTVQDEAEKEIIRNLVKELELE